MNKTLKQAIERLQSRAGHTHIHIIIFKRDLFIQCYLPYKGPIKRSEVFKNLIVDYVIFLFVLKLKSSDPYWRIFNKFS